MDYENQSSKTRYSSYTDEQLVECYRNGDINACSEIISRYTGLINHRSSGVKISCGDIDDIKQEAYMGLLSAIRTYVYNDEIKFCVYAKICIANAIKNVLSKSTTKKAILNRNALSEENFLLQNIQYDYNTPETYYIDKESYDTLLKKIEQSLSAFERDVLFSYLKGLSYEETAKEKNITVKSVNNGLQRARKKLKAVLREL